jgi:hypothetical protein
MKKVFVCNLDECLCPDHNAPLETIKTIQDKRKDLSCDDESCTNCVWYKNSPENSPKVKPETVKKSAETTPKKRGNGGKMAETGGKMAETGGKMAETGGKMAETGGNCQKVAEEKTQKTQKTPPKTHKTQKTAKNAPTSFYV